LVLAVRRKRPGSLPHPTAGDVALLGVATFKLSRLIAKEKVLSPVRQPFVERSEAGAGSELNSHPAGTGVRRALGELLTCPFCLSVWIATVLTASYALAPGATRLILAGLGAVAVADASQYGYAGLRQRVA
jgi:hypothetical protein